MSPRFERRPDKRTGGAGRGAGRPPRFSGPKPEWRPDGEQPRREPRGDRPGGRFERRSFDRRPEGERDRGTGGGNPYERRPAARPSGRFEGRPQGRYQPRDGGSREGGPREGGFREGGRREGARFEDGRRDVGRRDAGRREGGRFGAGRFERAGRVEGRRFAPKPLIVEAEAAAPAGEAERHSVDPSSDLVWGRHPAQAALESGRPIHRVWCTPEMRFSPKFLQLLREAKSSGVLVEEVTWARLGQITGGAVHQGIALQTAAAETLDLQTLIEGCAAIGEAPLLMAVDGLTDPQNLGAIVRSAEALGAQGLVLPQRRSAGLTGTVAKVAAGALEHLPVARVVNLNRALDALKQEGYRVVGLAAEGAVSLEEANLDGPMVVVTGSEGDGLSMLTRRTCDQLVRIPLRGATPSLNASVATALLLYEIARRGWMKGLSGSQPAPRLVRPQLPAPAAAPSPVEPDAISVEPGAPASDHGGKDAPAAVEGPSVDRPVIGNPLDPAEVPNEDPAEDPAEASFDAASPASPFLNPSTSNGGFEPDSPPESPSTAATLELGLTSAAAPGFWNDIQL